MTPAHQGAETMNVEVTFQPIGKRAEVRSGATILEAAQAAGVGISAICGGEGSCDACRIRLDDQEEVSEPSEIEEEAISGTTLGWPASFGSFVWPALLAAAAFAFVLGLSVYAERRARGVTGRVRADA